MSSAVSTEPELAHRAVQQPAFVEFGPAARALAESVAPNGHEEDATAQGEGLFQKSPSRPEAAGESDSKEDEKKKVEAESDGQAAKELSDEEKRELEELKKRDREVRAHEQAHKGSGGRYAGQISYEYERGPDGKNYAVGGEVPIDVSPVPGDPAATVQKMQQVQRAALAPADPSGPDRQVASLAARQGQQARLELAKQRLEAARDEPTQEEFLPDPPEPAGGSRFATRGRLHGLDVKA